MQDRRNRSEESVALIVALLRKADQPLTAYALQERAALVGRRLYPTQIYRALDRLIEKHAVRRIETRRGYMLDDGRGDIVAVCERCGNVSIHVDTASTNAVLRELGEGFTVERVVIEAIGCCAACREAHIP